MISSWHGDMWLAYKDADLFIITTNATIKKKVRKLVMGRGMARQAYLRLPKIEETLGKIIKHLDDYGFIVTNDRKIGAFQVKAHWSSRADPYLIEKSAKMLAEYLEANPFLNVHMNFPGIGYGGLTRDKVLPLLLPLYENPNFVLNLWTFDGALHPWIHIMNNEGQLIPKLVDLNRKGEKYDN